MMKAMAEQQRGLTFANLLLGAFLIVFLAIGGMKVVPAYVEDRTIQGILDTVAHDPDMQDATPADIRQSFGKRALINNITEITPEDIIISKMPTGLVLSVSYKVKIALVGNASLLLEFNTSSSRTR
jgi:uncharacterized protein DUF4845